MLMSQRETLFILCIVMLFIFHLIKLPLINSLSFKEMRHPKMNNLSLFTHVILNFMCYLFIEHLFKYQKTKIEYSTILSVLHLSESIQVINMT